MSPLGAFIAGVVAGIVIAGVIVAALLIATTKDLDKDLRGDIEK